MQKAFADFHYSLPMADYRLDLADTAFADTMCWD
jgi:hypothetical protein